MSSANTASSRPATVRATLDDSPQPSLTPHEIVQRLRHEKEASQRLAVFKLQDLIGDPSFADQFAAENGLPELQRLILTSKGNMLAYALVCLSNLLALDQGWSLVERDLDIRVRISRSGSPVPRRTNRLRDKIADLILNPSLNVQRAAMNVLLHIISKPSDESGLLDHATVIDSHIEAAQPHFYDSLVTTLSSADHGLCSVALSLINAFIRKSFLSPDEYHWTKFVRRLQGLGMDRSIYSLMQGSGIDGLAQPLLEYQTLTKILIRNWRNIPFDVSRKDHRQLLNSVIQASRSRRSRAASGDQSSDVEATQLRHLGLSEKHPSRAFVETGYLGMLDLLEFARRDEEAFQRLLLEQSKKPVEQRCPLARASIAVTSILYAHYEIHYATDEPQYIAQDSRIHYDQIFKPHLLQWNRLHSAGVHAFVRLWSSTNAESDDFVRVQELVRVLIEQVVSLAVRTKEIDKIEDDMGRYSVQQLRELQMSLLEMTHDEALGSHVRQVREDLRQEAISFMKEQRIRCMLKGTWFPTLSAETGYSEPSSWRFARLSHNRRWLHYDDFPAKMPLGQEPSLDSLDLRLDLGSLTSVTSNRQPDTWLQENPDVSSSLNPLRSNPTGTAFSHELHEITLHGYIPEPTSALPSKPRRGPHSRNGSTSTAGKRTIATENRKEVPLLTLHATSDKSMSEWFDGLLMLLDEAPATRETEKCVAFIADYGLKLRLLNVRNEEVLGGIGSSGKRYGKEVVMPSREGVDEDFFYDVGGD